MDKAIKVFSIVSAITVAVIAAVLGTQVAGVPVVTGKAALILGAVGSALGTIAHQLPQLIGGAKKDQS